MSDKSKKVGIEIVVTESGAVKIKQIGGDFKKTGTDAEKSAKKTTTAWDKVKAKSGGWIKSIKGMATSWIGVTAAVVGMLKLVKDSVEAFKIQEKAELDLAAALKVTGEYTEKNIRTLKDFASARQKVTTFGDEITLQNLSLLASFRMNTEQMKRATIAAQNLSVGLGLDLKASTLLLGKAFLGETSTLSRYGIVIEEGLTKSQKFEAVLRQLQQRFGGRAAAEVDTYGGKVKQLSNSWGDFTEKLGKIFIPVIVKVIDFLNKTITVISEMADVVNKIFETLRGAAAKTQTQIKNIGTEIKTLGETGKESVEELNKAFESLNILPKAKIADQSNALIESFKTIVQKGSLTDSQLITARNALFDKLARLAKEKGEAAFSIGFEEEPIKQEVVKTFDAINGVMTVKISEMGATVRTISERLSEGIISAPEGAVKRVNDTTTITLKQTAISIDNFLKQTLNIASERFPLFSDIAEQQVSLLEAAEKKITDTVKAQTEARERLYQASFKDILQNTDDFVRQMNSKLSFIEPPDSITIRAKSSFGASGSYATGLDLVPRDMDVRVHRGERIQRAAENPYNPAATQVNTDNRQNFTININGPVPTNQMDTEMMLRRALKKAQAKVF